jgi:hypothetical protein
MPTDPNTDPRNGPTMTDQHPETLLETVAEALAASHESTTFATAGHLIEELERRGLELRRYTVARLVTLDEYLAPGIRAGDLLDLLETIATPAEPTIGEILPATEPTLDEILAEGRIGELEIGSDR